MEYSPIPIDYNQKLQENESVIRKECSSDSIDWNFNSNQNDIDIFVKTTYRSDNTPINWCKGIGTIYAPALSIVSVLRDVEKRGSWDAMFLGGKELKRYEENCNLTITSFSAPWPVASREFVAVTKTFFDQDGGILMATVSVEDDSVPVQYGFVRGEVINSGFYLEPINEDSTRVIYVLATDPKGYIPNFVVSLTSTKQALLIHSINEYLKQNKQLIASQVDYFLKKLPKSISSPSVNVGETNISCVSNISGSLSSQSIEDFSKAGLFQKIKEAYVYFSATNLEPYPIGLLFIALNYITIDAKNMPSNYSDEIFFQIILNGDIKDEIKIYRGFDCPQQCISLKQNPCYHIFSLDTVIRIAAWTASRDKDALLGMADFGLNEIDSQKDIVLKQDDSIKLSLNVTPLFVHSRFNEFIGGAYVNKSKENIKALKEYHPSIFISNSKRFWHSLGPITAMMYILWFLFLQIPYYKRSLTLSCLVFIIICFFFPSLISSICFFILFCIFYTLYSSNLIYDFSKFVEDDWIGEISDFLPRNDSTLKVREKFVFIQNHLGIWANNFENLFGWHRWHSLSMLRLCIVFSLVMSLISLFVSLIFICLCLILLVVFWNTTFVKILSRLFRSVVNFSRIHF